MLSILLALLVAATGIPRTADAELTALAELRASETTVNWAHRPLTELDNGEWAAWAEVIAYRGGDTTPLPEIVAGWLASPEHAAILRDASLSHIGCGFATVGVRVYVVCLLARPADSVTPDPPDSPQATPPPAVTVLPNTSVAGDP